VGKVVLIEIDCRIGHLIRSKVRENKCESFVWRRGKRPKGFRGLERYFGLGGAKEFGN
jgi:hypothetical protein